MVATAAGAVPEVVGDGAVLTAPGDGDGLAAALVRVLDGGADVDHLVERGRRRSGGFSWEACAEGLARLYGEAPPRGRLRRVRGGADRRADGERRVRTLLMVEQLRRTASGGIGTYIHGLLQGLDALATPDERPELDAAGQPVHRRPVGARPAVGVSATRCAALGCRARC